MSDKTGIECRSQTRNGFGEAGLEAISIEIDRKDSLSRHPP